MVHNHVCAYSITYTYHFLTVALNESCTDRYILVSELIKQKFIQSMQFELVQDKK